MTTDHPPVRTALPTGTVTFLFTDIEGSTRLLGHLGPSAYAEALAEHRRILRGAFANHGGVEVDTQGDAIFVAFQTASGAVAAASSAQQALASGPIKVRIGIHTGTANATVDGYVGMDVHRGARVAALASGGQVIVSAATAALVEHVPLLDLGRHRLKDFDAPVQLYQVGTTQFPTLRTPGAVDLPTPATRFLGRQREFYEAATLWLDRHPRILTIVGPGGAGKTRLSIELGRFLAEDATGGTVFIALATVRDAALLVPMIAGMLGASDDTATAIATRVGGKQTHVILDNLEQLLPDVAPAIADLLAASPALRIVATSREPLRIAGEFEFDLPPMGEIDATALFLERAQAVRPDVADSLAVLELVRRLDGLPLAIELAAARVKVLGPRQLLERIGQRLDLLKGGRDVDERHATLRATIAWSYDLLDEDEQRLFSRFAIFRGGCTLADAEAVTGADIETLGSLLDKSLVRRRVDTEGDERFSMLETIRDFARECLKASGEEDSLRRAQADRLFELVDRAGTRAVVDNPQPWDFDLVSPEIDNLREVFEWALERDPERGLRLVAWLETFWVVRDPAEGAALFARFLARTDDAEPLLRARAFRALGGTLDILGEHARAAPCYQESLDLFVAAGSQNEAAHGRSRIAANMMMRGDTAHGWPAMEECLLESQRLGLRLGEAQALGFLSNKAYEEGDLTLALDMTLASAEIAEEAGWAWWAAAQFDNAGMFERQLGRLDAAEHYAERALHLALAVGDRRQTVFGAAGLAVIAAARGEAERAGRFWGALETEVAAGRIGPWERQRPGYEAQLLSVEGETFAMARDEGRLLTIAQAATTESDRSPATLVDTGQTEDSG